MTEELVLDSAFDHLRKPVSPPYKKSSELMNRIEEEERDREKKNEFRLVYF